MFVADAVATRDGKLEALSRWPQYMAYFDPLTLLPALAAVTTHVGLCATATTSYNEPYHIARKFASLDHISGGRAGWNVVTSSNVSEAFNFGRERHYEHDARYDRAIEFEPTLPRRAARRRRTRRSSCGWSDADLTRAWFYWDSVPHCRNPPSACQVRGRAIPCSDCAQQRHDIIPKPAEPEPKRG
jgi:hypothetical protein